MRIGGDGRNPPPPKPLFPNPPPPNPPPRRASVQEPSGRVVLTGLEALGVEPSEGAAIDGELQGPHRQINATKT